jgi:hypothetical protein
MPLDESVDRIIDELQAALHAAGLSPQRRTEICPSVDYMLRGSDEKGPSAGPALMTTKRRDACLRTTNGRLCSGLSESG